MIEFIGITGKAQSGKDSVADALQKELDYSIRYAMADPIKAAMFGMFGLETLSERTNLMQAKEDVIPWLGQSPRALMQSIGVQLREDLSSDIWIKFLSKFCADFIELEEVFEDNNRDHPLYVIIPDIRFNNEAEYIKSEGGIVIHVIKSDVPNIRQHVSEAGISSKYVDRVIENDGTLEDLNEKVKQLVNEEIK